MKERELRDRKLNIKREIEELSIMRLYDMDQLKEKEMNKLRPIKNAWYHW